MMRGACGMSSVGFVVLLSAGCAAAFEGQAASMGTPPPPPAVLEGSLAQDEVAQRATPAVEEAVVIRRLGGGQPRPIPRRAAQADAGPGTRTATGEESKPQVVVTGAVEISTEDVGATAEAVRAGALARGATIVTDEVTGARYGLRASFRFRLPPEELRAFIAWLALQGTLESSQLSASDVSREYYDQELRLGALRVEMDRLEKLMAEHPNAALADVLAIEREMTRVRAEIEQTEGSHRYLGDRVARATLDVHINSHDEVRAGAPEQKFVLVAHGLASLFADGGARHRDRYGAGVSMLLGRRLDLTLDVLPARGADERSILATLGGALYSDFLGRGRRRFLNPYLGLRLGAGGVNGRGVFAYGGELGVELVRLPHLLVDLTARAMGLVYGQAPRSDFAFQGLLGVGVPF